jgi:hypothetical protein
MKRWIVAMGLALGYAGLAGASQTDFAAGSVGAGELQITQGPRASALGDAFVTVSGDITSLAWNPAGIAGLGQIQGMFMHNVYLEETSVEYLAAGFPVSPSLTLGGSVTYWNYGNFEKLNEVFEKIGEFTPFTFIAQLGGGYKISEALQVGLAGKFYRQQIDTESVMAYAVDLGAQYAVMKELRTGIAVQNLGATDNGDEPPMLARAGAAYELPWHLAGDHWLASVEADIPFADTGLTSVGLGTEYTWNKMVSARVGYKIKDRGGLEGLSGLTGGVGVQLPVGALLVKLDYALVTFGDLGTVQQIAIGAGF